MRTRPVFESYDSFVNHLYSSLNEAEKGITFDDAVSSLGSSLDSNAKAALVAFRNIVRQAPAIYQATAADPIKFALGKIKDGFINRLDKNPSNKVKLSDKIVCDVQEVKFNNVVNGKVIMGSDIPKPSFMTDANSTAYYNGNKGFGQSKFKKGNWVDIYDYFTAWNTTSLTSMISCSAGPSLDDKNRWAASKDNEYRVIASGLQTNVISSISPSIQFTDKSKAGAALMKSEYITTSAGGQTWQDEKIYKSYVLYGLEDMIPIAEDGQEIPTTIIKPDFVTVEGEAKDFTIPIAGTDAMFQQGKSELNADNKTKTEQAIAAAIGQATSINSIKIVGGASFEGGLELNKQLVVGRANTVKKVLIDTFGIAADKITVDDKDFSKIQAKDESAKYPEYRKVYLTINGKQKGDSSVKEVKVSSDETLRAGSVVIKQYVFRTEFSSPDRVAPKK